MQIDPLLYLDIDGVITPNKTEGTKNNSSPQQDNEQAKENLHSTIEEEIKKWAEVYPIEEAVIVDLRPEGAIEYEGNLILPQEKHNIRKAKKSAPEVFDINLPEINNVKELTLSTVQEKIENLRNETTELNQTILKNQKK